MTLLKWVLLKKCLQLLQKYDGDALNADRMEVRYIALDDETGIIFDSIYEGSHVELPLPSENRWEEWKEAAKAFLREIQIEATTDLVEIVARVMQNEGTFSIKPDKNKAEDKIEYVPTTKVHHFSPDIIERLKEENIITDREADKLHDLLSREENRDSNLEEAYQLLRASFAREGAQEKVRKLVKEEVLEIGVHVEEKISLENFAEMKEDPKNNFSIKTSIELSDDEIKTLLDAGLLGMSVRYIYSW
jgi:hypothetical protein